MNIIWHKEELSCAASNKYFLQIYEISFFKFLQTYNNHEAALNNTL